jgi:5-methylcytosine-specific restriction endonuclease McrA
MTNHKDCLVLNADYSPIGIIDWRKAMIWSFRYTNFQYSGIEIIDYYNDDYIIGVRKHLKIPAVVKTAKFFKVHSHNVIFSRKNLFIRDDYTCQYCGAKPNINQLTYDHVIPKSKWPHPKTSSTSWTNIVTACFKCNCRKGNKTIQQAGMTLKNQPIVPQKTRKYLHVMHQLLTIRRDIPTEWKLYVKDFIK